MCRNIKSLYNYNPPVSPDEIREAALQYVRKISGFRNPSAKNESAFEAAVAAVSADTKKLLDSLVTTALPKDREAEKEKMRTRSVRRFGSAPV